MNSKWWSFLRLQMKPILHNLDEVVYYPFDYDGHLPKTIFIKQIKSPTAIFEAVVTAYECPNRPILASFC